MEEKMESEHSYSSDSSSASDSSSGTSEGDEEVMEPVRLLEQTLELPQDLCEDYSLYKEFFSMRTWQSLEDSHKEQLKDYLPKFTENDEEETEKTLRMLFNHEPFHFISPLDNFFNNLRHGNYRPDIAKMRKFLHKARAKQQRHRIKSYYAKLLPEVLISRERLLAAAKAAPPGPLPRLPILPPKPSSVNTFKPVYLRARQRYFDELAAIRSEVGGEESEDENYPEGPPVQNLKKRKKNTGQIIDKGVSGTLSGVDPSSLTSLACLKNVLAGHKARRHYRENHPELNTSGITLEDIKQRVALVNGSKKVMFGGKKTETPVHKLKKTPKSSQKPNKTVDKQSAKKKEDYEHLESKPLLPNIKIKCEEEESDSESSSFVDPVTSPKPTKKSFTTEIKQEVVDVKYNENISTGSKESQLDKPIKQEPQESVIPAQGTAKTSQPVPIKLEDLDGIDMMALPVELADDSGELPMDASEETPGGFLEGDESLTETTHANFLSLVRALFPARAAHRASKQQLHSRCQVVMKSPIAPLNTWYNLSDDWCAELDSALDFLSGERGPHPDDFVPYLQFIPETQMYQWIGAGRDCDAILGRLCERWLHAASPPPAAASPPPVRYPTSWVMRAPTQAEIAEFRSQERRRFASAGKPFTYVQHGYRATVGPAGGVGGAGGGAGAANALLAGERPRAAGFATLVRDAVARLPNGEGTRHDVLTLLKMSQWISPTSNDQALLSALSSVLDRLHSAKRDPIVKYDQRTAIWTYLHRNRSEEEWSKSTSSRGRGGKGSAAPPAPTPPTPGPTSAPRLDRPPDPSPHSPPSIMDMEVASVEEVVDNGSDSDVDVDDTLRAPSAGPPLLAAQLLMQATQAQAKPRANAPNTKNKGKLVPMTPQKPKATTPKHTAAQAKQANLMAQSAKQATLIAQSTKNPTLVPQTTKTNVVVTQSAKTNPTSHNSKPTIVAQTVKQPALMAQSTKQATALAQLTKQNVIRQASATQPKQTNLVAKSSPSTKAATQLTKTVASSTKTVVQTKQVPIKQNALTISNTKQVTTQIVTQVPKSSPTIITPPHKSPLIKQRPLLQKTETPTLITSMAQVSSAATTTVQQTTLSSNLIQPTAVVNTVHQTQNKAGQSGGQGARSLLLKPAGGGVGAQGGAGGVAGGGATPRRGVLRVLSPAAPSTGKSLISPQALMQQGVIAATKKRAAVPATTSVTTIAQNTVCATTVVSSVPTVVTSALTTRTVQLAGGRTLQLAANQTVHLPGGQAVQLASGHTLQLSSLQLPTHSVRLPSGQTVQLATPQTVQAVRAVSTAQVKAPSPRPSPQQSPASTIKTVQSTTSQPTVQIPVSTVQLSGHTVQIAGQSVQLTGQSVQLTGHTVKLPSGQSVQVASQNVIQTPSVQLSSGQTVQLASGNVQTVQLGGQSVQLSSGQNVTVPSGQNVQLGSQTVQIGGQTVQLAGGQTVQLPSGQTLQLSSGQTVQLSSGQTLQLASGQTVQLGQQTSKSATQLIRAQAPVDKPTQPIVAKLLTNAQGGMVSIEGAGGVSSTRLPAVRVVSPARLARPLLLAKPHTNYILQQSDGTAIRVTSSGGAPSSQTIVISNIGGQAVTTTTPSAPVLKLQQMNPIHQLKLPQGIKIQQSVGVSAGGGVRSVLVDGQQLKLVGGRHVLARILRPPNPHHQ